MMKTYTTWLTTRMWCLANPDKKAAIVTPEGTFTIVFQPKSEKPLHGEGVTHEQWERWGKFVEGNHQRYEAQKKSES